MKKYIAYFLAGLSLTFSVAHATTSLYESGTQGLPNSGYFNYYMPTPPQLQGDGYSGDQTLGVGINGNVSFGDVSCNGLNLPNMFASFTGNITQTINYYYSNALSIAFNYLVYSSPSLYQILEDTNRNFSHYFNQGLLTCQGIQNRAKESNPLYQKALGLCMTDKHNAGYCSNNNNLAPYVKLAADQEGKANQTIMNGLPFPSGSQLGGMSTANPSGSSSSSETGTPVDYQKVIDGSSPGSPATKLFGNGLTPQIYQTPNPPKGAPPVQSAPRTLPLHAVVECRAEYYSKALQDAVTAYIAKDKAGLQKALVELNPPDSYASNVSGASSSSSSSKIPSGAVTTSSIQKYCTPGSGLFTPSDNTGGVPVTQETIYELALMKQTSSLNYSLAVNGLAQSHALAYGDYLVGQISSNVFNAESSGKQATFFLQDGGAAKKLYNAAVERLKNSMRVMHTLHQDALEQQQQMSQIAQFNEHNNSSSNASQPIVK